MTSNEIRKKFLEFFKNKAHRIVPSDSLVPKNDPTVLFTTAGMQQFKRQFLGQVGDFTRAASSQKCLRTDDLEHVGRTPFHHTFFEMLGNFSFGDYFKKEAIAWAWEFLTKIVLIPSDKLWVTVYEDDAEAEDIWLRTIGLPKNRLVRLGDKTNFWPSEARQKGPNGPCGPCSEIFYDYGVNPRCPKKEKCDPSCDCGRFSEIWNLVFTQFNRTDAGALEPLPGKNIDTGMGLERLTAVIQGKTSNYDSDLFLPIRKAIANAMKPLGVQLELTEELILADHIRAMVFAIADGVIPSNKERGSVVKRLIADSSNIVLGQGADQPIIHQFVAAVIEVMRGAYPDIQAQQKTIEELVLRTEEAVILGRKLRIPELSSKVRSLSPASLVPDLGHLIFVYRDTFGLPLSTIIETVKASSPATQAQLAQAMNIYREDMLRQQERSRKSSKMAGDVFIPDELNVSLPDTAFLGYETLSCPVKVLKIFSGDKEIPFAAQGHDVKLVFDQTPFYAESGGQVGDNGKIIGPKGEVHIKEVKKVHNSIVHFGTVLKGTVYQNDAAQAQVDEKLRLAIMRNHTATHLLQAALRHVLGTHVQQQGSLVTEERLRFDFCHPQKLTALQIQQIEDFVYERILACDDIKKETMSLTQAREQGALAFFEEKYEEAVRVVSIAGYSRELCGGTHLHSTGQIGLFKIISESSIAQGIRRIEAKTGWDAFSVFRQMEEHIRQSAGMLKASPEELVFKIESQNNRLKSLEKALSQSRFETIKNSLDGVLNSAQTINGIKLITKIYDDADMELLRRISDVLKERINSGIIVLGSRSGENAYVLAGVTEDLIGRGIKANELVQAVAPFFNGNGGGRPQMAQAGSREPERLAEALEESARWLKKKIST